MGKFSASLEGVDLALKITLKANAIVLFTIALIGTIPILKFANALKFIGIPDKLVAMFYFCDKYVTILHNDYTRIRNAMKLKGFKPGTNLRTYKVIGNMLGILLVTSHIYSEKLYNAMLCRGFNGKFPAMSAKKFNGRDLLFLAAAVSVFILTIWINR